MPILRNGAGNVPSWCEMTYFEIRNLKPGGRHVFFRKAQKEKLFLCGGHSVVETGRTRYEARSGDIISLDGEEGMFRVQNQANTEATFVRVCGHWGQETGGAGVFTLDRSDNPKNIGDPTEYPRNTVFDNHYHDFDEYWIIVAGQGRVRTENRFFDVGAGDCVATGRGRHHDFPEVREKILGVYFETTLEGKKRLGHLWNHTHGLAKPVAERT